LAAAGEITTGEVKKNNLLFAIIQYSNWQLATPGTQLADYMPRTQAGEPVTARYVIIPFPGLSEQWNVRIRVNISDVKRGTNLELFLGELGLT
jgi:hypothetical protein